MSGETCNHCDGDLGELGDGVLAVICPHCHKPTGVCANCNWHFIDPNCCDCPYDKLTNERK